MKIIFNENTRDFLDTEVREDYFGKTMLMLDDGLRSDYIANSVSSFNKVIMVKMSPSTNNPKIDSILRKNRAPQIQIATDSGKYILARPRITFKAWNKNYINWNTVRISARKQIKYKLSYEKEDNTIYLPRYVYFSPYKNQRLNPGFEINIPEGAKLYFTQEVADYLNSRDQQMVGGTWQITNKGFTEISKK